MFASSLQLPSGIWAGHYVQFFMKHAQQMNLEFADGLIRGDGSDGLGVFAIEGEYRADQGEVRLDGSRLIKGRTACFTWEDLRTARSLENGIWSSRWEAREPSP
jgi:hypothetical protein